jgi:PAS domain S-box-containing protein
MHPPVRLRIVHLEDDPGAYELVRAMLAADGITAELEHVDTPEAYRAALVPRSPDLILADFNLPGIDGLTALALKRELCPDIPFIFVSGSLGEEVAVESLHNGATDFVLKGSLGRLVPAVRRALHEGLEHQKRLRAEESLRESEARFRRLAENAPDVIFRYRFTPEPGYDYISAAVERLAGYTPEEFYADPLLARSIVHPDDREEIMGIAASHVVPLGPREVHWITRDGRSITTEHRYVPVRDEQGRLIAVEGIARDISERKRNEEQIRLLSEAIEQSPVVVIITDPANHIVFASARLFAVSGFSRDEVLGQDPRIFSAGRHPPGLIAEMWQQLKAGRVWQGEFINRRKTGEEYVVRSSITPVFDDSGTVRNYLAVQEDVTEARLELERRRELEAQLFQAQKMESIGTLAGGIAHDFNNILTGILGFTEIAGTCLADEHPARADLAEVRKAGLRAKDLVAQILTFSRQKDAQQISLDLARTVEEVLKLIRASAPATIEIERRLQSGSIRADPVGIHQIVLNLCTNAIHAMRGTTGRLIVEVQPVEVDAGLSSNVPKLKPGPHVRLTVSDTGHGMDAATQARLFEPFFTTKKIGEGTGLGLALVKGIVNAHNAAIRVSSAPGAGATFDVYFPACVDTERKEPSVQSVAVGRGERVLVVDDEKSVGSFVGVRLEQLNYQVEVFNDPRDALAAIRAMPAKYAVLVTDLTMPHLTGRDLVRAARIVRPDLPAVIMSGYGSDDPIPESGPNLVRTLMLTKPFNGDDLGRVVAEVLQSGA